ncbi:hypothetical protein QZH41_000567 [Actinostola sp. cb2023]|nr:hypothetical protein QZH41_000567 [Actinostola sp. cb2023]
MYMYIGKNQVAVGVVPIGFKDKSSESALSVYPIAIGNCKEKRFVQIMVQTQKKPVLAALLPKQILEDLHKFLHDSLAYWDNRQQEVADTFAQFVTRHKGNQPDVHVLEPKRKRRKTVATKRESNFSQDFSHYAAQLHVEFFVKVCCEWRNIALTMRDTVFGENDDQLIDIHDVKCKEWGFLLKKLFGVHLGTGDYGHLTIDHSAMLLRGFRSMRHYSGQGFESSHKLHRQLFSRATNHDASGPGQSCDYDENHLKVKMVAKP